MDSYQENKSEMENAVFRSRNRNMFQSSGLRSLQRRVSKRPGEVAERSIKRTGRKHEDKNKVGGQGPYGDFDRQQDRWRFCFPTASDSNTGRLCGDRKDQ